MKWSDVFKVLGYACAAIATFFAYNSMTPAPEPKPVAPIYNWTIPIVPNKEGIDKDKQHDEQIKQIFDRLESVEKSSKPKGSEPVRPDSSPAVVVNPIAIDPDGADTAKVEPPKTEVPVTVPKIDAGEVSSYSKDVVDWQYDLEEAKTLSKKLNRPLLICFTTDGCGPCLEREKFVYPISKVWQKMHREFISVYLHVNDKMNQDGATRYGITRYPRVVIDDGVSKPKVFMPANSPDEFLKQIK